MKLRSIFKNLNVITSLLVLTLQWSNEMNVAVSQMLRKLFMDGWDVKVTELVWLNELNLMNFWLWQVIFFLRGLLVEIRPGSFFNIDRNAMNEVECLDRDKREM